MQNNNQLAIIALVAALGVLGVIMLAVLTIPVQEAEARPNTTVKSCDAGGVAFNASQGRCFNP